MVPINVTTIVILCDIIDVVCPKVYGTLKLRDAYAINYSIEFRQSPFINILKDNDLSYFDFYGKLVLTIDCSIRFVTVRLLDFNKTLKYGTLIPTYESFDGFYLIEDWFSLVGEFQRR